MTENEIQTIYVDTGPEREPEYLGDGLYASRDDMHIILKTERPSGVHYVALDRDVFERLIAYKQRVMP